MTLLKVNAAFAEFVGLPKEKILGMTTFDLVAEPDVAQQGRDHDLEVIRTGKPVLNQLVKWSGLFSQKEIWALYSKLPFYDSDGSIIGTVSFIVDIDDRKRAEDAQQESEESIGTSSIMPKWASSGQSLTDRRSWKLTASFSKLSG